MPQRLLKRKLLQNTPSVRHCIVWLQLEAKQAEADQIARILPPAILVAASGRMIRMHEEDYHAARNWLG